ncbi:MAG: Maf family nucleotide pyrophosphatase [candidate division KSB1 bacterium]|nr:Maf family nucleotide pyrophosphatase [candidate division KSB1 bacterium]MDZ7275546.1 Maf family nucleotide pyrophosphatase [candidate division KSB1 bacterium]MDZ7286142.1 Maf family nucleotide pyrophosphatase [candidate division KSB1 bacterium]MDZ7296368.1 Maf family nucleotide pyrophosphatase [candidate division KSB1 bacterium]MDZ7307144.1 Maf family nucleotide pyrophosphatase [candidate division KSB1 bacterium]
MIPDLILVSTSPYRRELMAKMGFRFRAVAPRFTEEHVHHRNPGELALALARGKALSVASDHPHAILIGSDQVVWFEGRVLTKAGSPERAWRELQSLRGKTHEFYMGLFLHHTTAGLSQEFLIKGTGRLRADLSDEELRTYVALDNPSDCAGSVKTEGPGLLLFERLDCEDWTAIIGLPIIALTTALRKWNYPIFAS